MSLVSQLEKGQITPGEFVKAAAEDIKKDLGIFAGTPLGENLLQWANAALEVLLTRIMSPTTAGLLIDQIEEALGVTPPTTPPHA